MQLGHPEVAFDLVVGEGDREVVDETQHLGSVLLQPPHQVGALAQLPPPGPLRVLPPACLDDAGVAPPNSSTNSGSSPLRFASIAAFL